jgi:hypothetical protein
MMAVVVPNASLHTRPRSGAARLLVACVAGAIAVLGAQGAPAAAEVERDPGVVFVSSTPTDRSAWAHDVPAGLDRFVVVAVTIGQMVPDSPTVMSLQFAGRPMTFLGAATGITQVRTELWGLVDPPVGSSGVDLRLTGSGAVVAGSVSFRNVDPAGPTRPVVTGLGTGTVASVVVPSAAGEYVVDAYGGLDAVPTVGAGQSVHWDERNAVVGASSGRAGVPTSTVMAWDHGGVARAWVMTAIALKPRPPPPPDAAPPPQDMAAPPADAAITSDGNVAPPADAGIVVPAPDATTAPDVAAVDSSTPTVADAAGAADRPADARVMPGPDAGAAGDAASGDGGEDPAVRKIVAEVGCACDVAARRKGPGAAYGLVALGLWAARRRARRR